MTKVRIQLFNSLDDEIGSAIIPIADDEEREYSITAALIRLLKHTWSPDVGDSIKIMEF
jgi:hypothetical protein